jgi:hypothetical protein
VNLTLQKNKFLYVPNFISHKKAKYLSDWLTNEKNNGRLIQDPRFNVGLYAQAYQDAIPFVELLCEKSKRSICFN